MAAGKQVVARAAAARSLMRQARSQRAVLRTWGFVLHLYVPYQNLRRIVACTLRIGLGELGRPNSPFSMVVFQLLNVTWFSTFVASRRISMLYRSRHGRVRPSDAFKLNCDGPV